MQVYSFLNTVLLINGVEITGWAEGDDVIQVKRLTDSASHKTGSAGEMMVTLSADRSTSFMFKLQQTSDSNAFLYGLAAQQEGGADTFVPVTIKFQDVARNDVADGTVGYMKRPADMTRGAQGQNVEWEIIAENGQLVTGSGNSISSALSAITA